MIFNMQFYYYNTKIVVKILKTISENLNSEK
jgi:hypothetical protein